MDSIRPPERLRINGDGGESKEDYDTVVTKFESYCVDKQNDVHERYIFRTRLQAEGESFEQFLRDLKKQDRYCNFGNMVDDMVRDQIVYGTNSPKLREKMLRDKKLTLEKAVTICKTAESAARESEVWNMRKDETTVDAFSSSRQTPKVPKHPELDNRCTVLTE